MKSPDLATPAPQRLSATHHDVRSVETYLGGPVRPPTCASSPHPVPAPRSRLDPSVPTVASSRPPSYHLSTMSRSSDPRASRAPTRRDRDYAELLIEPATTTSVVTTTTTVTTHFAPIRIPKSRSIPPPFASGSSTFVDPWTMAEPVEGGPGTLDDRERRGREAMLDLLERDERELSTMTTTRRDSLASASGAGPATWDPRLYPLSVAEWNGPDLGRFKLELGDLRARFVDDPAGSHSHSSSSRASRDKGKAPMRAVEDDGAREAQDGKGLHRSERGALQARRASRRHNQANGAIRGVEVRYEDEGADVPSSGARYEPRKGSPGPPPRKRPRSESVNGQDTLMTVVAGRRNSVATALPSAASHSLPSPSNQGPPSPVPTSGGEDSQDVSFEGVDTVDDTCPLTKPADEPSSRTESTLAPFERQSFDFGPSPALSTLLSIPDLVETFDHLSPSLQSYLLFQLLKRSPVPVLQTVANIVGPALRRDFLTDLPPELGVQILGYLDATTLCRASLVCKSWRTLVDGEWRIWKKMMKDDGLWVGDGSEERDAREIATGKKEDWFMTRWKAGVWDDKKTTSWNGKVDSSRDEIEQSSPAPRRPSISVRLASPSSSREPSPSPLPSHLVHPYKTLYRRRWLTRRNWKEAEPRRTTFTSSTATTNVVTCLQFDDKKIVSGSDDEDHSIHVFDTQTGSERAELRGHSGGVWALQYVGNVLVSGSTDRSVRVWDLETAKCTHEFIGHTSTVRCLQIVEPINVNPDPSGEPVWEPPCPMIVTGSRDWSLRVWKLPLAGRDREFHPAVPMSPTTEGATEPTDNPYYVRQLSGHRHAVRAVAAAGRTVVSGSYDHKVRVWDLLTGECRHELVGHSQKVYSVVLDHDRQQCASGSMDGTVRLWSTETGECRASLDGHSSLVGLLGLSHRCLVSAAADWTLRIWDPDSGECRHSLNAHQGAITCFQHDEYKIVSGSDGTLKMWDTQSGEFVRDLLANLTGVWQVAFNDRYCIAAVQRNGTSEFELLDFGAVDQDEIKPTPQDRFEALPSATNLVPSEMEQDSTDPPAPATRVPPSTGSDVAMADAVPRRRSSDDDDESSSSSASSTASQPPPTLLRSAEFPRREPFVTTTTTATASTTEAATSTPANAAGAPLSSATSTIRRTGSLRNIGHRVDADLIARRSNDSPSATGGRARGSYTTTMEVDEEEADEGIDESGEPDSEE
ncbi:hypothetical protein JCM10212_006908 [Sporobolomyces blumeae]